MSLASVAGFCAVVWWLMIGGMVVAVSTTSSHHPSSAQPMLEHWNLMPQQPANGWLLALIWLLAFIATMVPRALAANIFSGFVAVALAASQIKDYQITFSLRILDTFIAANLAYTVAKIMREGARAAEENREFV